MNEYETTDLHLASYLRASGLKFIKLKPTEENMKVSFVFNVPFGIDLAVLLNNWHNDFQALFIKEVLMKSGSLKAELKNHFIKNGK